MNSISLTNEKVCYLFQIEILIKELQILEKSLLIKTLFQFVFIAALTIKIWRVESTKIFLNT